MPTSGVSSLGSRIREERLRRGVSLRGLARDVGVSASMISQIETGKTRPSVSTLYAITSALGVSIEEVFAPAVGAESAAEHPAPPAALAMSAEAAGSGPAAGIDAPVAAVGGSRLGPVVQPADRQKLTLDTGVTWERLGELAGQAVDFLLVTYPPGGSSSSTGGLMRHSGAEYGFLTQGELVLTLGFEEVRLHAGDAVSFESTTPHSYRNEGTEPAVGIWFVIERDVLLGDGQL
jgi:transcriptional regulator with XRE-family HTH domain/quercetin dioxygenase-like cupin family protein